MASINFVIILLLCLGLIDENSSQNNPDNYAKIKNDAVTIEYKITASLPDFSQLHSPPLGPVAYHAGEFLCYKGVHTTYSGKNYSNSTSTRGAKEEGCYTVNIRGDNSIRLLGSPNSKFVHLYSLENTNGDQISYSADAGSISQENTNSIIVVGEGVQATFYTLPSYGGASVCVSVGNGTFIHNRVSSTTTTFGFTTIRSFKFGCNSKKIIQPMNSIISDYLN